MVAEVVPGWRPSGTLDALQELVDVAAQVPQEVARRAGLSTSELHALRHLSGGAMGPVDLARALGVTSAAASGVVDRLAGRGHVERRPHPDDRRRTEVVLTDSGSHEVAVRLAPMFAELARVDSELGPDEQAVVERYLRGATRAMKAVL
ncbi:MarR family transcriptional regulator [Phycicoccus sp. CSK15P-2]|uniref:MarR family winged helix-turn-helix transcriptional regulator n=1 Tax=Phycicoccus sp. CSK15P-2 TaxID=2807627 RepID=UPI0019529245|nr:MarR family transcriptional regulator [Phycicoccus sp. CSK15P-2]MBM6405408.1 MarR family transcriptional regulator [Phycicoccus sp. CSK15P-2]